jgi:hypothetical protein
VHTMEESWRRSSWCKWMGTGWRDEGCPRPQPSPALKAMAEGKTQNWSPTWCGSKQGEIGWLDSLQAEPEVG